ncbi:MFS transporter [Amnibacterium sp. CER49]|uniref:MFS transporter n=1 Tax=Amnibacterium sp. CER49 TaxID=3039161 RepID=UPI002449C510|nr:MFS transporter [Amnibacterium sp. CER49]MDH2444776.1 MFS transporter [Amnibacterium sp. CER49]
MTATDARPTGAIRSLIPARMDRLPWTRFHWTVVLGLGVSWILDGLEIQMVSANGFAQQLHMNSVEIGLTGTIYLIGQVVGALVFGRLSDRLGRRRFFILTLAIYLVGSGIAGLAFAPWFLWIFRFVAGMGIGGEYTAINSAIDEIIPSHYRGRVDIAINGTYWGGAALGAAANLFLLTPQLNDQGWGWRIGFFIGPVLGLVIIYLRRHIPESPRWQLTHGQQEEAEANVERIEREVEQESGRPLEKLPDSKAIEVVPSERIPFSQVAHVFLRRYPRRTFVGLVMMITQSFLYNAIFFSYALVLQKFFHIPQAAIGLYFFPFAIGNLAGPLVLGPLFDTLGRRKMIFGTYVIAGLVLALSGALFAAGALDAVTQTILWCVSFFFASAGASSAYLTVSETFPLQVRGQAISYFFSIGQLVGAFAPTIFGALVGNGSARGPLAVGDYLGAGMMIVGGIVALIFGVSAERKGLEDISDINFMANTR